MNEESARNLILGKLQNRISDDSRAGSETVDNGQASTTINFSTCESFISTMTRNGAHCQTCATSTDAVNFIQALIIQNQWPEPPVFAPALAGLTKAQELWPGANADVSTSGCVAVSHAYCAIADTGTLVLLSAPNHPTGLNFLPEHHVVLLDSNRIVEKKYDVWNLMRKEGSAAPFTLPPRAINLISGPSRTADIEQTIQLGAHGPRSLTVILVQQAIP